MYQSQTVPHVPFGPARASSSPWDDPGFVRFTRRYSHSDAGTGAAVVGVGVGVQRQSSHTSERCVHPGKVGCDGGAYKKLHSAIVAFAGQRTLEAQM
jgi:hypothetical protein